MPPRKRTPKKRTSLTWVRPMVIALILCAFIGMASVGYVWQKDQNVEVYDRIAEKQAELKALHRDYRRLVKKRDHFLAPEELEKRVQKLGLDLRMPEADQIIQLDEPVLSGDGAQVAESHESRGVSFYASKQ